MEKFFENEHTFVLFLLFFLPGFISLKVYDLLVPSEPRDFNKSILDAVAYSTLNFIALFWLIALMRSSEMPVWLWYVSLLFVGIGMPALWPKLFVWIRDQPWFTKRARTPASISRVWDSLFIQREQYWVIAHLKDRRKIGGVFSVNSFASSSPAPPEIYLEEVWQLDENGCFDHAIERTAGILILGEELVALELFRYNDS